MDRAHDGEVHAHVDELAGSRLFPADVRVGITYSSLNHVDAAITTSDSGLVSEYPHVPGFDFAGRVESSRDPRFATGDAVLATGRGLGMVRPGGFATQIEVPGDWLTPIPTGLDDRSSMVLGTAGLTAAMALEALESCGTTPVDGDLLVTGASGGVGCLSVALASSAGFRVVASTRSPDAAQLLRDLGAASIVAPPDAPPPRPLMPERWAAAIDVVGSFPLAHAIAELSYGGSVAACGFVGGTELTTDVTPLAVRGVNVLGIASVYASTETRGRSWRRLADSGITERLHDVTTTIGLAAVPGVAARLLAGGITGRVLVEVGRRQPD